MTSLKDIRTGFLEFFRARDHEVVASSPLVPRNDPTLLFTNAGMVQFKNVFTGQEKRAVPRAATAQKCVRAGGKHNDLDRVGYTARHHTFFEMLGNFSFGDYFKERAIEHAWTLVTKDYGLAKDRLLVTVYSEDDEAHGLWKKIAGLPDSRIVRIATSDNFWSMGDVGPCGPCSEIFYDHGAHIPGGPPGSPEEDGDRFIEIWNLVFMQYEQFPGGKREALPRPSIDTGMGLERIAAVMQGVHDNYDVDLFRHLIAASAESSGASVNGPHAVSHRVIADHLRSSSFLIADGVLPSNEGRGYVLRRIMRRGMRHAHILGSKDPLMHRLVPTLVAEMGEAYPELKRAESLIAETLRLEEGRFRETLARGLRLVDEETETLTEQARAKIKNATPEFMQERIQSIPLPVLGKIIETASTPQVMSLLSTPQERWRQEFLKFPHELQTTTVSVSGSANVNVFVANTFPGADAFKLYDTFGFPRDLTEDALRERGIKVDIEGFDAAMARQKAEARKAWSGSGEAATDTLWFKLREELGPTEFLGYDTESAEGAIAAIVKDGALDGRAETGETVRIVTNQTPFYGEGGGQVGDTGAMFSSKGAEGTVVDTEKKLGNFHIHVVKVTRGNFSTGDAVELRVDSERRRATRANHSATHLLHAALKHVLGSHVAQKGSLVSPDRLRFDFSHPKAMSLDELKRVEDEVNEVVRQNNDVSTRLMPTAKAIEAGAVAMFGEKYGDEVRVLAMGRALETEAKPYSVELCGGTHVRRLGDIGLFTILAESAVAAGVRRVEALTSEGARRYLEGEAEAARKAAAVLKTSPAELPARIAALSDERRRLERELSEAKKALALAGPAKSGGDSHKDIAGLKAVLRVVNDVAPKDLKALADEAKEKLGSGVVAFVTVSEGKASLVVGVTQDLTQRVSAVDLVRAGVEALGGKGGGGRPDMAQGGGPETAKTGDALTAIEQRLGALAPAA